MHAFMDNYHDSKRQESLSQQQKVYEMRQKAFHTLMAAK